MMNENFHIQMEAKNPERKNFRSYCIDARKDLFGRWVIEISYGRIGARGRKVTYSSDDEQAAKRIIRHCLKRRSTAPRRIGVPYQIRELCDPKEWAGVRL